MTAKIRDLFLIVMLWLVACAVTVVSSLSAIESVAGEFGFIAMQVMGATGIFMGSFALLPWVFSSRPVVTAFYAAVFVIALALFSNFWLVDFIRSLLQ